MDTLTIEDFELQRLREGVAQTQGQYARAQRDYDLVVSIASDTGFSWDGSQVLKLATNRYDIALSDYNAAVRRLNDYYLKRH